jgi:hypothetical protein
MKTVFAVINFDTNKIFAAYECINSAREIVNLSKEETGMRFGIKEITLIKE